MLLLLLLLLLPTGDQTVIVEIEFKKEEVHGLRQHVGVHNGQAQVHPRHRKTLELKSSGRSDARAPFRRDH